jgi:hypothetical protein
MRVGGSRAPHVSGRVAVQVSGRVAAVQVSRAVRLGWSA